MNDFKELENLEKVKTRRVKMPNDVTCYVCGCTRNEARFRKYNEYCLCEKHFLQLEKHHKITDHTPRQHKKESNEFTKICDWLNEAIPLVKNGTANRLEKYGCVLYKCGTVIRLDIKNQFEK